MKLTHKLFYIEIAFFVTLMVGILVAVQTFAFPEVEKIERGQLLESLHRVEEYIKKDLARIHNETADWAEWDDTYRYVANPYPEYEESNLIPDTLETLNVDLLMIVNDKNELLWKTQTSKIPSSTPFINTELSGPNDILNNIIESDTLFSDSALLKTAAGPLMIAKNSILTSKSEGPPMGALYFGKIIDDSYIDEMSDALKDVISAKVVNKEKIEPKILFQENNQSHLIGFLEFANSSTERLQVDIYQERHFYSQILNVTFISLIAIAVVGGICCFVTYLVLRRILIDPIVLLQKQADFFKKHSHKSGFSVIKRDDEIGQLSSSFAAMAEEISQGWNKLNEEKALLKNESLTDSLTQAKNRRFLESLLNSPSSWELAKDWSFIALDLDHFKNINDTHGHEFGDTVLKQFTALIKRCCRERDFFVRTGGEEFLLICRGLNIEETKLLVERILLSVRQSDFGNDQNIKITCSIGFFSVGIPPSDSTVATQAWPNFLKIADLALYAAKRNGRDTWIGLSCSQLCTEAAQSNSLPPIKEWISSKQLELLSPKTLPKDFHWIE